MREDTWSSRTERVGRMLVDDGWTNADDLNWVRWRLAVSLNEHWYKSSGASVRAHVFEPMDGDIYSLPVASPDCAIAPTYFGRLSRGAIRVDDSDTDLEPGCQFSAHAQQGDHPSLPAIWAYYTEQTWEQLGLAPAVAGDHSRCWHSQPEARYPLSYELAVLLRTHGRTDGGHGSIAPARADHGELQTILASCAYQPVPGETPRWLQVDTADGECWLGPRGHVVLRGTLMTVDPAVAPAEIAGQVVDRLRGAIDTPALETTGARSPAPASTSATAAERRGRFVRRAEVLAADLDLPVTPYMPPGWPLPSGMIFFADPSTLVVAVGEETAREVDKGLAYGLAHAGDRDLVLLLPFGKTKATALRCAYLDRKIRLFVHDGITTTTLPVPARPVVLEALREPKLRGGEHDLGSVRADWVRELEAWSERHPDLAATHRQGYRSWQCAGRRLLELRGAGSGGITLVAGVQASAAVPDDKALLRRTLTEALDPVTFARIRAVVENGVADRLDGSDGGHGEHRLQATLIRHFEEIGWSSAPRREFPARRPGGGTGYIDFLRLDRRGVLHIIETKIGDDEFVVLQSLDYWMWATANEKLLAKHFNVPRLKGIVIDLLLGESDGQQPDAAKPIISSYGPGQLEAIDGSIGWEVFRVSAWATEKPHLAGLGRRRVPDQPDVRRRPSGPSYARALQVHLLERTPPGVLTRANELTDLSVGLTPAAEQALSDLARKGLAHHAARNIRSSQAFALNLFAGLDDVQTCAVLTHLGLPAVTATAPVFEWSDPADDLHEASAASAHTTQVDVVLQGTDSSGGRVGALIEVKLSETDFGHCSAYQDPSNTRRDICLSTRPFGGTPQACHLLRRRDPDHVGRTYPAYLEVGAERIPDGGCTYRLGVGQPMRNVALAGLWGQRDQVQVVYALCAPTRHQAMWRRWQEAQEALGSDNVIPMRSLFAEDVLTITNHAQAAFLHDRYLF